MRVYHDKSNDNNHGIGRGEEWDYSEDKVVMRHLICGKKLCISPGLKVILAFALLVRS